MNVSSKTLRLVLVCSVFLFLCQPAVGQVPVHHTEGLVHGFLTLPSESVSHNWLYFVVVVAMGKWEAAFCFPLIHSLLSSVARRQLAIAAVLRFQFSSNCVGLT